MEWINHVSLFAKRTNINGLLECFSSFRLGNKILIRLNKIWSINEGETYTGNSFVLLCFKLKIVGNFIIVSRKIKIYYAKSRRTIKIR